MMMMMPLSQSHLVQLDTCARKYQYVFFEALSSPSTYDQHLTTQWGSQFHLLMQQQSLDLPVGVLSQADADMARSLAALKTAAPSVFAYLAESQTPNSDELHLLQDASAPFSQSEHRRTLAFNGYLLTVVYDLLVTTNADTSNAPINGQIFDWKTHQKPPKENWLQKDWQTRLYPYVLCETSALTPEQISMTYWFVRTGEAIDISPESSAPGSSAPEGSAPGNLEQHSQKKPSFYRFDYTLRQHDETRKELQRLTDSLTQMRAEGHFPKVAAEQGMCSCCPFNVRCDRALAERRHHMTPTPTRHQSNRLDATQILKAARQLTAETVEEISL